MSKQNIFKWLVRLGDNSTETREFKRTKTGEFVPFFGGESIGRTNRKTKKNNEPGIITEALASWRRHTKPRQRGE